MLLQKLVEYSQRMRLPPRLYSEKPIRYIIELDEQGRVVGPGVTDTADPKNPKTKRGVTMLAPEVVRTSAVRALLLADKADYVLGYVAEEDKKDRVASCHRAFVELVERCAEVTQEPAVIAVARFLRSEPLSQLKLPEDFDPSGTITFRVNGSFPIELRSVQQFWAKKHDDGDGDNASMQCLVCGEKRPPLERLQVKIKGIPGGQTSGTAIISANAEAFESYGLTASLVAPTCAECGERFSKSLNELLSRPDTHRTIGDAVYVAWTRNEVAFNVLTFVDDPQPEDVQALVDAIRFGRRAPEVDEAEFYAVTLTASGGRAVVRDWIDTTVLNVKESLVRWFQYQRIVDGWDGEIGAPLGIQQLASATVLKGSKVPSVVTRALLRTAMTGAPLPANILHRAVQRCRAEQQVTRPRAALIKLCLLSSRPTGKEDEMVQLDPEHPSAAYHCGRLMAVLEAVQRRAIPGINATIVDRFYGTASTAPVAVFPRLLKSAQPHLAKLERDAESAYVALQQRLEQILAQIKEFPRTLTLDEQGLFALGYYHQRAYDRAQARAAAPRRASGLQSDAGSDLTPETQEETDEE